jgi:pantothenate kinase
MIVIVQQSSVLKLENSFIQAQVNLFWLSWIFYLATFYTYYQQVDFCVKATGGGAYKYADLFKERLGVSLDKEDEMNCLVAGANFLLKVKILI